MASLTEGYGIRDFSHVDSIRFDELHRITPGNHNILVSSSFHTASTGFKKLGCDTNTRVDRVLLGRQGDGKQDARRVPMCKAFLLNTPNYAFANRACVVS